MVEDVGISLYTLQVLEADRVDKVLRPHWTLDDRMTRPSHNRVGGHPAPQDLRVLLAAHWQSRGELVDC